MQARRAFDRASGRTCRVVPAVPILFFGNLDAYQASPVRVLTAGLNPSRHEFPADRPFRRFPLAEGGLEGKPSQYLDAMHTDICSPVATNPTWSRLDKADRVALEQDGGPLWHMLLKELRPQIVALSVGKMHLGRIAFPSLTDWRVVWTFRQTRGGSLRSRPYEVRARWFSVGSAPALFVFGTAAQTPFGLLAASQKRVAGKVSLRAYRDGG